MKSIFDKLNLRPGERRLVVGAGIVVFIVLNLTFVWPNFGAYAVTNKTIGETQTKLQRYKGEVRRKPDYERQLKELENKGIFVADEDQALQLQREVNSQATLNGVNVLRYDPAVRSISGRTNAFFDESSLTINFSTGEKELVDFLYSLGKGNSLIRVFSMNLAPELPARTKLQGSLTLVESFQKKAPPKPATPAPAPKATTTPPKTTPPKAPEKAKQPTAPPKATGGTNRPAPLQNRGTNIVRKTGQPGK